MKPFCLPVQPSRKVFAFSKPKDQEKPNKQNGANILTAESVKISRTPSPQFLGKIPRIGVYLSRLFARNEAIHLNKPGSFAIPDCDADGKVSKLYVLIERLIFGEANGEQYPLFVCSCPESAEQRGRLKMTNKHNQTDLEKFVTTERLLYCIHAQAAEKLKLAECPVVDFEENDEISVKQICLDPLLVAVFDGYTYGILKREPRSKTLRLRCRVCLKNVHSCSHIRMYNSWCTENGLHAD